MRYEDMPSLPLATNGRAELLGAVRKAVTQCELLPKATAAQGDVSAAHSTALASFFTGIAAKLTAVASAQNAVV